MAATRIVSRLRVPTTLNRLSAIGNSSGPTRHFFSRNLPDLYFGPSSNNIFRDMEKQFDRMQQNFDRYFRDFTGAAGRANHSNNNNSLINYPSGFANEGDMIVTEADGTRKFQLAFDMRGFEPEEVKIRTQNGALTISAKKEKKADNSYSLHEFSQTYTLPQDLKLDDLKSTFGENGVLSIEAPLPKVEPKNRQIQIEHTK